MGGPAPGKGGRGKGAVPGSGSLDVGGGTPGGDNIPRPGGRLAVGATTIAGAAAPDAEPDRPVDVAPKAGGTILSADEVVGVASSIDWQRKRFVSNCQVDDVSRLRSCCNGTTISVTA